MPIIYVNPAGKKRRSTRRPRTSTGAAMARKSNPRRARGGKYRNRARTKGGGYKKLTKAEIAFNRRARAAKTPEELMAILRSRPTKKRKSNPKRKRSASPKRWRQPKAPAGFRWVQTGPGFNDGHYVRTSAMAKKRRTKKRRTKRTKSAAAVHRKTKRRKGTKRRAKVATRHTTKRRKGTKRRYGTKALRGMVAAKGYKLVRRKKRKGARKTKRHRPGTRTRVARHMQAAYAHHTYPVANPSRRRRRKNPARHRRRRNPHRRYRRNPGMGNIMAMAKKVLPVLASVITGKLVTKQIAPKLPGISSLGSFQGPAMSVGLLFLGHVLTNKVRPLQKHKDSIMLGLGLNVATEILAMTPLKGMLGLGEGIYDRALSDYITTSDYVTTGAVPIDDNIALADYVTTGGVEEELGISEELGLSEELGAISAGTVPGGLSQTAMMKAIPAQSFSEQVPARSFTQQVSHAGAGYDNPGGLYAGIFRGGF